MPEPVPGPRIGVYPGTFDPMTNGHLDIVARAVRLVDTLVVGVAENAAKAPLLSLADRVALARAETAALAAAHGLAVRVVPFSGLLVEFARAQGARLVVRGLRAVSDFEFEFQMAGMNSRLDPGMETVFLMASERHQFIASHLVKEVARMGGDISGFVPARTLGHILGNP